MKGIKMIKFDERDKNDKVYRRRLLSFCNLFSLSPQAFIFLSILFTTSQALSQTDGKLQMEYYKLQLSSAKQEKNALKIASVYGDIVTLCRNTPSLESELPENLHDYGLWSIYAGNYQTAIDALVELLDMPNDTDNKTLLMIKARANNSLGMTYFFLERWDDALVHYQKTLEMAIVLQDNMGISIAENNIGNIYQKKRDYQRAIEHYQRCLQLQEKIDDKETICNAYFNLGTCYIELKNFKKGVPHFNLALNLAKNIEDKEIEALSLIGLASYYAKEKRHFVEAIKLITQAEQIAKEAEYKQVLNEVYLTRSSIEEERGDFVLALAYYKNYKMLNDSLFNEKSVSQLQDYEIRYQTAEKQIEIERQQLEIKQYKTRQLIYTVGIIAAGLLLIMFAYIIILRTRRTRELAEMNAIKDKFFSIISHDLKNPAIAQRDALQLLTDHANKLDANALSNYHQELLTSANGLVNLLKNLLNWAQIQTGREIYHPSTFDLVAALQPDINVIKSMAERKNITFEAQLPPRAIITGDENMLITVIRNLLANAVKFTASDGNVSLQIAEDNGKFIVTASDTGVGMTQEQIQNLFRINSQQTRTGTAGEQSTGLGLIVCRDMLQKHNSQLHIESEEGKGSRFWFALLSPTPSFSQ